MRIIPPWLKKIAPAFYGALGLPFFLPLVGQNWGHNAWEFVLRICFVPLYGLTCKRLGIIKAKGFFSPVILVLFIYMVFTGTLAELARKNQANFVVSTLYIAIALVVLGLFAFFAPNIRAAYDHSTGPVRKPVEFDIPVQSREPANHPRV